MAGEVRDGQDLVAQRRHEQEVHPFENARHLLRDLAPQPIRLHEIDSGQESRLAEGIRPRIGYLHRERVDAVRERQLFPGGCRLGEEDDVQ